MAVKMIKFYGDPVLKQKSRELKLEELETHQQMFRDLWKDVKKLISSYCRSNKSCK